MLTFNKPIPSRSRGPKGSVWFWETILLYLISFSEGWCKFASWERANNPRIKRHYWSEFLFFSTVSPLVASYNYNFYTFLLKILELKIKQIEHLLRVKDKKIEKLKGELQVIFFFFCNSELTLCKLFLHIFFSFFLLLLYRIDVDNKSSIALLFWHFRFLINNTSNVFFFFEKREKR